MQARWFRTAEAHPEQGQSSACGAWWMVVFPGVMIVITVLSINLVGDGVRDIVDPKRRHIGGGPGVE